MAVMCGKWYIYILCSAGFTLAVSNDLLFLHDAHKATSEGTNYGQKIFSKILSIICNHRTYVSDTWVAQPK